MAGIEAAKVKCSCRHRVELLLYVAALGQTYAQLLKKLLMQIKVREKNISNAIISCYTCTTNIIFFCNC